MTIGFMMPTLKTALLAVSLAITTDTLRASDPGTDYKVNLAVVATPSSSYVSGDTSLRALNDNNNPRNSRQRGPGSYGNWPRTGTQWVQYDWTQPISTRSVAVYWWDDRQGVRLPKACRLLYWTGTEFVLVPNPSGLGVAGDQFNITTFDEVRTTKLRLEIDGDGQFSTGLLEWKVFDSGNSPEFPPSVTAGVDRTVVLGGKTYLKGQITTLKQNAAENVQWSKVSGPGQVTFDDAQSPVTAAGFSDVGVYVLRLSAGREPLRASSDLTAKVEPRPPSGHSAPVHTSHYKLNSRLWNARAKALIAHWIPHCIDQINRTDLTQGQGGIDNFIEAAKALRGEPHGRHKGYVFANAWVHQTVESMCIALMVDNQGDPEIIAAQEKMKATLEDWIPKILAAQEPDGYLHTAYTLADRARWPERWSPNHRGDHEGYV
ncbi:MAG: Tat pathway signal protein, partial [Verrucomicrobiota bacterium]|nr:Tat pathway signal protein [Verrucomicrobiota bacterium]